MYMCPRSNVSRGPRKKLNEPCVISLLHDRESNASRAFIAAAKKEKYTLIDVPVLLGVEFHIKWCKRVLGMQQLELYTLSALAAHLL